MSVSLGIFDIFANAIPGLFYLFVFNEIAKVVGIRSMDFASIDNLGSIAVVALVAYILGHVMDYFSYRVWDRIFHRRPHWLKGHENFVNLYSSLKTKFQPTEGSLLFSILRYERPEAALEIERYRVIGTMLRNISFASGIFALLELFLAFRNGFSLPDLFAVIIALVVSSVALRRGDRFSALYYQLVFEYSVIRGNSLQEVLKNVRLTKKQ